MSFRRTGRSCTVVAMSSAAPDTTSLTVADLEWAAVIVNEQIHNREAGDIHSGLTTALRAVREMLAVAERVETERAAHAERTHAWVVAQADSCECGHERRRHQLACHATIGFEEKRVRECPCDGFRFAAAAV